MSSQLKNNRFLSMLFAISLLFPAISNSYGQQQHTIQGEPPNLGIQKLQLLHYHNCGETDCYLPQFEKQIAVAADVLQNSTAHAKTGEKLAVVLDIDETSLSNWASITHDDFGYIPTDSDWCIALHCGKALVPTLGFYRQVRGKGVAVFFITGRPEAQRAATEINLKQEGYLSWQALYLRPDIHPKDQSVTQYKSSTRAKIVAQGYRIIVNIGDQESDLAGEPKAETSVKVPNPFYYIP